MQSTSLARRTYGVAGTAISICTSLFVSNVLPLQTRAEPQSRHDMVERLRLGNELLANRAVYRSRCADCHGERGRGTDRAQIDFAGPDALIELTPTRFREALVERHDGRLAVALSAEESRRVVNYVRSYLMLPAPDADTALGRTIYAESCSVCHGDRGNAASWAKNSLDPPPADFTTHALSELTRAEMIDAVTFGEDGTAMMPFAVQLDRQEIAAAVDFIRAAFMSEEATGHHAGPGHDHGRRDHSEDAGHADASHGAVVADGIFPGGLVGDPIWGRAFYDANCAECHGKEGNGEGPRAYFMVVKPANFLSRDARAELTREELFEYISDGVVGTTMPAWEKVLRPQQIANVGEYVYRAFLHPEDFATPAAEGPIWRPARKPDNEGQKKTDLWPN